MLMIPFWTYLSALVDPACHITIKSKNSLMGIAERRLRSRQMSRTSRYFFAAKTRATPGLKCPSMIASRSRSTICLRMGTGASTARKPTNLSIEPPPGKCLQAARAAFSGPHSRTRGSCSHRSPVVPGVPVTRVAAFRAFVADSARFTTAGH